ncbi:MAG: superoxide dismutase [Ni] [Acidobacteriota bacterium]|jgi:nickel superoxide dismutase|nr:superoxide dismutase [Ni] [Acidobacteriota bacterium]
MKKTILTVALALLLSAGLLRAHCQIPCGIYDDMLRVKLMLEHVDTIEKSMKEITRLSRAETPDWNQLVRWVSNKDHHADELTDIVTYYFMTQRINPARNDAGWGEKYINQLTLLHAIMIHSMKAKQTLDLEHCVKLRELINQFKDCYFGKEKAHEHKH